MVGQRYYGAAAMTGRFNGELAHLTQRLPVGDQFDYVNLVIAWI
jgi:hypothetical protein